MAIAALALGLSSGAMALQGRDEEIARRARLLLDGLNLEEKAALASGADMWRTKAIPRIGIPAIRMADGPHGLRKAPEGQFGRSEPATCFPPAVTLAASWDPALVEEIGHALGREARAQGVDLLLGPGVNIKRSPLGGRNFEYFSEDPRLSGELATAFINGVQAEGVGASLKHFVVNDQEHERMTISAELSERALREIYLLPFELAVQNARPATIMSSYNRVNGEYVGNSALLLDGVLRRDWGFKGVVVSDWGAVDDRVRGIRAGLTLQMPGDGGMNDARIVSAVRRGELEEAALDEALRPLLELVLRLDASRGGAATIDSEEHHALAARAAAQGVVLLKNTRGLLPLAPRDRIALIGRFAEMPRYQGSGSSQVTPTRLDTLAQQLDAPYASGYDLLGRSTPKLLEEARRLAGRVDKVVLVIGLTFQEESEGFDRAHYGIAPGHLELLEALAEVNPNLIVVLQNGSPVEMPWLNRVGALVEAYLGGQAGGRALADVLTGAVNPSGKLAETFPHRIEDNPSYLGWPGEEGATRYGEDVFVGYRYYDARRIEPLFPFGFGLSYTRFAFDSIRLDRTRLAEDESLGVRVRVRNTGERAGQEVVQLYIEDLEASVHRPPRELKHFQKVALRPGESREVAFRLSFRDFAFWSARHGRWVAESGRFRVHVGNSSRDLPLVSDLELQVNSPPRAPFTRYTLVKELLAHPEGERFVAGVKQRLERLIPQHEPGARATDAERVTALQARMLLDGMLQDLPLYKLGLLSGGSFGEAELESLLERLNR